MIVHLSRASELNSDTTISISGSKSESNRLLILKAFFPELHIENLSNSDDTKLLAKALSGSVNGIIDIHHAGTAMRFLTAYFAVSEGAEVVLTGSDRMKERPIRILVEALRKLGAEIEYTENDGFPPLRISGKKLDGGKLSIAANTSSQYISALLLIASVMKNGIELTLEGNITSKPYIDMTLRLLDRIGCRTSMEGNTICVNPVSILNSGTIEVESDWSSASYFFSLVALSPDFSLQLKNYRKDSLQGDAALVEIYKYFGIETIFDDTLGTITISNKSSVSNSQLALDLSATPDLAQTITVSCFGLGIGCNLTGLHTLKIKETDRLVALKTEIEKLGGQVKITDDSLYLFTSEALLPNVTVETYQDHRMAMAFAPLALKTTLSIANAEVVSKSYPNFWKDLTKTGVIAELER